MNGTENEDKSVFYIVNNTPVTYSYFTLNLVMIAVHVGIIVLNSCMVEAIKRSRKVEEPGGHCLISLSVAYIWHGLMMIYTGIYGLVNPQQLYECLIRFGLVHSSFMLIGWANCLLTVDRFLQIEYPFWYKRFIHIKTVWIANTVAVFFALGYGLSPLIFQWYNPQGDRINVCQYFEILPKTHLRAFYAITFSGFPFLIFAYTRLLYVAHRHKTSRAKRMKSAAAVQAAKHKNFNWKPLKIVLVICSVYFVCWAIPGVFGLVLTINPWYTSRYTTYLSTMTALIMAPSISAIINPCIYTLHREVKRKFLGIICCKKRRKDDLGMESYTDSSIPDRLLKIISLRKRVKLRTQKIDKSESKMELKMVLSSKLSGVTMETASTQSEEVVAMTPDCLHKVRSKLPCDCCNDTSDEETSSEMNNIEH